MEEKTNNSAESTNEVKVVKQNLKNQEQSQIKSTQVMSKEDIAKALKEAKEKNKKGGLSKTKTVKNKTINSNDDSLAANKAEMEEKVLRKLEKNARKKQRKESEEELSNKEKNKLLNAVRYLPKIEIGLKKSDVEQRIKDDLTNKQPNSGTKTYWKIIYTNVFTFFNILLLTIAVALLSVGKFSDCFFMIIAIANTIIGIIQEVRAKQTIDKLKLVTAPNAKVIRDGEMLNIPTEELVLDDIMLLSTGNQIGADAIVKFGQIEVNESLLTGESLAVKKKIGDMVLAGSFVVSGSCTCQVERVGSLCYANALQQQAKKYSKPKSELVKSLNGIIKVISIIIIPIGIILFWINYRSANVTEIWGQTGKVAIAIASTAGSLVGMIPAGLFLLTSMALAAGILRLSKSKTLVQELYCIEMLARTNCLCLDKTGTLTDGTMKVSEVVIFDNSKKMEDIMGSYLSSFEESNQTSIALANYYPLKTTYRAISTIPFSSARKFSAVSFENNGTYLLGAPEFVYKGNDEEIKKLIASRQKLGYRVMMLCKSETYIKDGSFDGSARPIAIFILLDHIRKEAPATIKWFNENGVDVKIISGDNPYTASNIAANCGVNDADKCVSLEGVSIQETKELATRYTVFGRVSPEQKAALVQALKANGKTVAMTGDGVNDILAMKNSDCSIAMAAGADAAKNVAHLVLLDSNFASMPKVVEEGRRVINNVQRSSSLFLMKTIFTVCLTLFIIIINLANKMVSYPFQPSNLILMEVFGIGIPSFFLALQPNKNLIKGHFLKNTLLRALPGSIAMLAMVGCVSLLYINGFFELSGGETGYNCVRTLEVFGLLIVSLSMLYIQCTPFNIYRIILFITMLAATIVCAFTLPSFLVGFDYTTMNKIAWLMFFVLVFALPLLTTALDYFFSLFRDDLNRLERENNEKNRPYLGNIFKRKKKDKSKKENTEESKEEENNDESNSSESNTKKAPSKGK